MTIAEMGERGKRFLGLVPRDIWVTGLFLLSCSASFGLGILTDRDSHVAKEEGSPLQNAGVRVNAGAVVATEASSSPVVASKNGTKFYPPDCPAALRISPANKIWFGSAAEALTRGYQPSKSCVGF